MKNNIKIPVAFQIRVDDVGWHNGEDERCIGQPSRTGIPRNHVALDYPVIHELGKALNMKINCAIVLGEWDKDNLLRGQNNLSWNPDGWDRASEIDMDYAEKAFDILENSEYIAYTFHGVTHGHYDKGKQITEREFYMPVRDENGVLREWTWHTDEVLRNHLDFFYKIYNSWGFKKPVKAFAGGGAACGTQYAEGNIRYAGILKEYGIDVWENGWHEMVEGTAAVIDGMVALRANGKGEIHWAAYDVDPDYLTLFNDEEDVRTDYCIHWPNLLRWNPEKNLEYLPKWVNFFNRQTEVFGTMMGRDVLFAASQAVYNKHAKLSFEDNKCIIDLAEVDAQKARALKDEFYISFRNGTEPKSCIGGTISEYEIKKEFKTYKIVRENSQKIEIIL